MGLYIKTKYGQSKHEFVEVDAAGGTVNTSVGENELALFIGPNIGSFNQLECKAALEVCRDRLIEASVPAPSGTPGTHASGATALGEAKPKYALNINTTVLSDSTVAICYHSGWRNIPGSSNLFGNAVDRLIEWLLERKLKAA